MKNCKSTLVSLLTMTMALLLIVHAPVTAQTAPELHKKIAPLLLQQDFDLARDTLQKIHAGLYRYKSKAEIDRLFDSRRALLKDSLDEMAFFRIMRSLISGIEDGHTACFLTGDAEKTLFKSAKFFPVQPLFLGQRAYVACETKALPAGTEILAIDHQPVKTIRRNLFGFMPSDGAIQTGKEAELNKFFFGDYAFTLGERDTFMVDYKTLSGKTGRLLLPAVKADQILCKPLNTKVEKYLQLSYHSGNIAVLTISSFLNEYLRDTGEDLKTFLASSFRDLSQKNIHKLIIDLRDNKGGQDDNGALLSGYLTNKPFRYYDSVKSTTKTLSHPNLGWQQPKANNFTGKVAFLINGTCFSTTAEFCAVAKSNHRGIFIGEETGGGYYGNTSGDRATVILPNSKIRVNIPMSKYVLAIKKVQYKDRGVMADVNVVPTIQEILAQKDPVMIDALKIMK